MNKIGFLLMMTKLEKQSLQKIANRFGYNLSEYIRRKLFNENTDLSSEESRYLSPVIDKHNLLTVSILYKILYLLKEILIKQGSDGQEVTSIEQKSLEFAREQRAEDGYKVIESNREQV